MNKKYALLLLMISCFIFDNHSQDNQKTNEIGMYAAPGFHLLKKNQSYNKLRNDQVSFGLFYMRSFSPHAKWRIGISGIYESGVRSIHPTSSYSWSSVYIELPAQFQYIINPDSRFAVYTGVGLSFRRVFYTKSTSNIEEHSYTHTTKNNKIDLEFAPSVFIGLNARLSNHFSLFLQPGFSPVKIYKKDKLKQKTPWPNFLSAEFGLIYKL